MLPPISEFKPPYEPNNNGMRTGCGNAIRKGNNNPSMDLFHAGSI